MDCGVVGKFDKETNEELATAFVVKRPNTKIKESDVIKFVAGCIYIQSNCLARFLRFLFLDNISYHKRLHGGVIFVDSIPKSPTGKILRRSLREKLHMPSSKL